MTFTKALMIVSAVGLLAACEEGMDSGMATSQGTSTSANDPSLIRDAGLVGKLDSAAASGNAIIYAYFTDVVDDGRVLEGADRYCGGPGQAVIQLTRGEKGGRGYNSMAFTCR